MLDLEIAIELTVPDNTAFTALVALRGLGYAALERVERADILRMQLERPPETAPAIVDALQHAEVIFNPNKHRLRWEVSGAKAPALQMERSSWEAVVFDRDDDTGGLVRLLGDHFGIRGINALERAIAWRLYEARESAPRERLEWACRELLANPYSQRFEVRAHERT